MEKKVKMGVNALWIVGIVFTCIGGLFMTIGVISVVLTGEEAWIFGSIYALIGGIFLALGLIFLLREWKKKKLAERLLAAGRYVWGEVTEITVNYAITINRRHPYVLLVQYRDGYGTVHQFRSRNLLIPSVSGLVGKQVKVYYEDQSFRHYYVELENALPNVVEH